MNVYEDLLESFSKLKLSDANEAETRKKLIDKVLENVLDWKEADITYEERVSEDGNTTFADYIVRTANASFVVEAKRVGTSFLQIPKKRKVKLTSAFLRGETGDAIRQARNYCRSKSIPYAVVTNGNQWIVFPATRTDGIEFSSSHAIIFDSLDQVLVEERDYFVSILSRDGVIEGNLDVELIGRSEDQIEERRLNNFHTASNGKAPNPIYPLIENAVLASFSDSIVSGDSELLEKCYVKNADRMKFDSKIKMHLNKREPFFDSQPKRPLRKREASALEDSLKITIETARPLAILILGTVGAGKTTFLQFTRRVAAKEFFKERQDKIYPHWIEVDFRDFSKSDNPKDFLYRNILSYLKKDAFFADYNRAIRSAYKQEIDSLKNGPMFLVAQNEEKFNEKVTEKILEDYNKVTPYVDNLLSYASSKTAVFLVVDNVDQFEDEKIQSDIFSDAIALSSKLRLNLIISMRESTYVKHRNSPIFDAFDFDPLQVEPPEIPAVLSKRFFMAKQLLDGVQGDFKTLGGVDFKVNDLSVFMEVVQSSVLGTEVGNRIDVLANHDVRLALRMTREFMARGYTDPAKALSKFRKDGRYTMPKQEAFRSILLGNQAVYSEKYSVIGNPFDSRLGKTHAQALRLFVLAALVKINSEAGSQYVESPSVKEKLNIIGFSEEDVSKVLEDLCEFRFLHTSSHGKPNNNSNFYPSRLGGYVVKELVGDFTFLENVLMDTFIANRDVWENLKSKTQEIQSERDVVARLEMRVERVKAFYEYMVSLYHPLVSEGHLRALDSSWLTNPLLEQREALENNFRRAIDSARRNYG